MVFNITTWDVKVHEGVVYRQSKSNQTTNKQTRQLTTRPYTYPNKSGRRRRRRRLRRRRRSTRTTSRRRPRRKHRQNSVKTMQNGSKKIPNEPTTIDKKNDNRTTAENGPKMAKKEIFRTGYMHRFLPLMGKKLFSFFHFCFCRDR